MQLISKFTLSIPLLTAVLVVLKRVTLCKFYSFNDKNASYALKLILLLYSFVALFFILTNSSACSTEKGYPL